MSQLLLDVKLNFMEMSAIEEREGLEVRLQFRNVDLWQEYTQQVTQELKRNKKLDKRLNDDALDAMRYAMLEHKQEVDNITRHKQLTDTIHDTYKRKNRDYGNSFSDNVKEFGTVAGIIPISNKFSRLKSLLGKEESEGNESILDTLLDLANYALLLYMELDVQEESVEIRSMGKQTLKDFVFNKEGSVPVTLLEWELEGAYITKNTNIHAIRNDNT